MLKHLQARCSYEVYYDNEVMELLKDESSDL